MAGRWTDEQRLAIEAEGGSLIVSAAAGSGKTSVLVARLLRQLSDNEKKIPVERTAVVTFTNDAAAEMKKRLNDGFAELISKNPDNSWVCRQQSMLVNAKICTIHSFCFDLIRDNIQALDISSGFRIMEENEERVIADKAVGTVIEEAYLEMPDGMDRLCERFCTNSDDELAELIIELNKRLGNIPFCEKWLDEVLNSYKNYKYEYMHEYLSCLIVELKSLESLMQGVQDEALKLNEEKLDLFLEEEKGYSSKLIKLLENESFDAENFAEIANGIKFKKFPPKRKDVLLPELREYIKSRRDEYKESLLKLTGRVGDVLVHAEEDCGEHYELVTMLKSLIIRTRQYIWDIKVNRNAIGFGDAERLALEILSDTDNDGRLCRSGVAEKLSKYYEIILIDEFQDTNNNQELIFRLLSDGGNAEHIGKNVFMVGDVKQSIYRFRMANPKIFMDTMELAESYEDGKRKELSCIKLNRNFRSSKGVVDFVNYVFENIMHKETGEIEYNEDERLVRGAGYPDNHVSATQIALIQKEKSDKANYEAKYVAEQIEKMLKRGYSVTEKDGKTVRPCEMRDFCILMRNRKNSSDYVSELEKRNISAYAEETAGYLKSREVSVLLNFLRIIDNPLIETALASVMLSEMFMFTADEITQIRLVDREANLFVAMCEGIGERYNSETGEKDLPLLEGEVLAKSKTLYSTVNDMRMYAVSSTLEELIRKIYEGTDFLSVMQIYKDSEKRKANLRILIEYAKIYEDSVADTVSGGVGGFLAYIDNILRLGGDMGRGSVVSSSENVVMIKTIHKSKGLEFPFVFLVETDSAFSTADKRKVFQFNMEKGIGFKLQDKEELVKYTTLPYEAISCINERELVSEEMRLLYVALTRARERLFISLEVTDNTIKDIKGYCESIKRAGGLDRSLINGAKSMSEWLIMVLAYHKNSSVLRDIAGVDERAVKSDDETDLEYVLYEFKDNEEADEEVTAETGFDFEIYKRLKERIDFKYDKTMSELPARLSVSDIAKQGDEMDFTLKRPAFMHESTALTPAEKGTAVHGFLQYADFDKAKLNPDEEIKRLVENGYLSPKQGKSIDVGILKSFFSSDLYKRIEKSKHIIKERKFMVRIDELGLSEEFAKPYKDTDGMLSGIIDLIFEEDGMFNIVDYKTDYIRDENRLTEMYGEQIYLYKKAFERISGRKAGDLYLYSFSMNKAIKCG